MDSIRQTDLFPDARNPENAQFINERCSVRTQDGYRVVTVSGIALTQYAVGDRLAEAHAMVSLVEQGWADQNDVARVFGYSARTVRRGPGRLGPERRISQRTSTAVRCPRAVDPSTQGSGAFQSRDRTTGGGQ